MAIRAVSRARGRRRNTAARAGGGVGCERHRLDGDSREPIEQREGARRMSPSIRNGRSPARGGAREAAAGRSSTRSAAPSLFGASRRAAKASIVSQIDEALSTLH